MERVRSLLKQFVLAGIFMVLWRGILLGLSRGGIHPDHWVADVLEIAATPANLEWITWVMAGALGLSAVIVWEWVSIGNRIAHRLPRTAPPPQALDAAPEVEPSIADLRHLFDLEGPERDGVWMTVMPDDTPSDTDVLLLIAYGYLRMLNVADVNAEQLRRSVDISARQNRRLPDNAARVLTRNARRDGIDLQWVEQEGQANIDRGHLEKTRLASARTHYRLTEQGRLRAAEIARDLIRRL